MWGRAILGDGFYKDKKSHSLQYTSTPTGVFASPLDFINKSRPWLMIGESASEKSDEKYTLIFAYHFFDLIYGKCHNTAYDVCTIRKTLFQAQQAGFRILIQLEDGKLAEWDDKLINKKYKLDPKIFTRKRILNEAWQQHRIAADDVLILDYFSLNTLFFKRKLGYIDYDDFFAYPDEFLDLLLYAGEENFDFFVANLKEYEKFLRLDFSLLPEHVFNKIKGFEFYNEIETKYFAIFCEKFPQVKRIKNLKLFHKVEDSSLDLNLDLKPGQLSHLSHLSFSAIVNSHSYGIEDYRRKLMKSNLANHHFIEKLKEPVKLQADCLAKHLTVLLSAAPFIESLSIGEITDNVLGKLKVTNFPKLTELKCKSDNGKILAHFLSAAASITKLEIHFNFSGDLDSKSILARRIIDFEKFDRLEKLSILAHASKDFCSNILKKSIKIKQLEIDGYEYTPTIGEQMFVNITHLSFENSGLTNDGYENILKVSPNIELLVLPSGDDFYFFPHTIKCNRLKTIKKLQFDRLNLLQELRAPVEEIYFIFSADDDCYQDDIPYWIDIREKLKPNLLPFLKKAFFNKDFFPGGCINVFALREFLQAAPKLELLDVIVDDEENELTPEELKRIKSMGAVIKQELDETLNIDLEKYEKSQINEVSSDISNIEMEPTASAAGTVETVPTTCSFKEYFPGIAPNQYRTHVGYPEPSVILSDFKPIHFESKDEKGHSGMMKVETKDGYIILPSLHAGEELLSVSVVNARGMAVDLKRIKIHYNNITQFYAIKLSHPGTYSVHFKLSQPQLPSEVKIPEAIKKYKEYKPAKVMPRFGRDFQRLAHYVRENEMGSCKHRSIAAHDELQNEYKENIRVVYNDVHMAIELKIDGRWCLIDLGGNEVKLEKIQMNVLPVPSDVASRKIASPSFEIKPTSWTKIKDEAKTSLLIYIADHELKHFYSMLRQQYESSAIFVAHEPEELSLSGHGITQDGKIKSNFTRFSQWLKQQSDKERVICIDIREFSHKQLPQLNDLLDGRIENEKLPETIRIVLIDQAGRHQYGDDFNRRVQYQMSLNMLSKRDILPQKNKTELKDVVEIDLFESPFWHQKLVGSFQLKRIEGKSELAFEWCEGQLLTHLNKTKNIIFKNPPRKNHEFDRFIAELESLRCIHYADQTITVPDDLSFYQDNGHELKALAAQMSIETYDQDEKTTHYFLSNLNILSFTQDLRYDYSDHTNCLEPCESFLSAQKKSGQPMSIICVPGVSESVVVELLTAAKRQAVPIRFLINDPINLPSCLKNLHDAKKEIKEVKRELNSRIEVADDVDSAVSEFTKKNSVAACVNISALEATELSRYPEFDSESLLKNGTFHLQAKLSPLVDLLNQGKTVVLYGKISAHLYEEVTRLVYGYAEKNRFSGRLKIIVPRADADLVKAWGGRVPERIPLSVRKKTNQVTTTIPVLTESKETEAELSDRYDKERIETVLHAVHKEKIVLVEAPTAAGKTHFAQEILPRYVSDMTSDLETWLTSDPTAGKPLLLCLDEANFKNFTSSSDNFLERFESLLFNPPGFLWKGKYYPLTENHHVICFANPLSYEGGRVHSPCLEKHALHIAFKRLPGYYIRERIIISALKKELPERSSEELHGVSQELSHVFQWLNKQSEVEEFITAREIKLMIHLLAQSANKYSLHGDGLITLAREIAYFVGQQTLEDHPAIAQAFAKQFGDYALKKVWNRQAVPPTYLAHQHEAYQRVTQIIEAKNHAPDLGLGGIILEGNPGIGKTHFLNKIEQEYQQRFNKKVYRISPNVQYAEKENILRQAFAEGALVIADEINTNIWPNKLLNHLLMGKDEKGKPAKTNGFMLIATQNPRALSGREKEDPAFRRRVIKLKLDWPVYDKTKELSLQAEIKAEEKQAQAVVSMDTTESENFQGLPLLAEVKAPESKRGVSMDTSGGEASSLLGVPMQSEFKADHSTFFSSKQGEVKKRKAPADSDADAGLERAAKSRRKEADVDVSKSLFVERKG